MCYDLCNYPIRSGQPHPPPNPNAAAIAIAIDGDGRTEAFGSVRRAMGGEDVVEQDSGAPPSPRPTAPDGTASGDPDSAEMGGEGTSARDSVGGGAEEGGRSGEGNAVEGGERGVEEAEADAEAGAEAEAGKEGGPGRVEASVDVVPGEGGEPPGPVPAPVPVSVASAGAGSRKLFVGRVPFAAEEEHVRKIFEPFGTIAECYILRAHDGKPRGCAFVRFDAEADTERAMEDVNDKVYMEVDGFVHDKPLVVRYADEGKMRPQVPDQDLDRTKLFIGKVPYDCNEDDLRDLFKPHGEILQLYILRGSDSRHRGCGFVRFETAEAAAAAMEQHDGKTIMRGAEGNMALVVQFANSKMERPPRERRGGRDDRGTGGGKDWDDGRSPRGRGRGGRFDERDSRGGRDSSRGRDRDRDGFRDRDRDGFRDRDRHRDRDRDRDYDRDDGRGRGRDHGRDANDPRNDPKIFVGQLPFQAEESHIKECFQQCGTVTDVTLMRDPTGKSKGCAFVTMQSIQEAENAIQKMNMRATILGRPNPITAHWAKSTGRVNPRPSGPRGERFATGQQQIQQQWQGSAGQQALAFQPQQAYQQPQQGYMQAPQLQSQQLQQQQGISMGVWDPSLQQSSFVPQSYGVQQQPQQTFGNWGVGAGTFQQAQYVQQAFAGQQMGQQQQQMGQQQPQQQQTPSQMGQPQMYTPSAQVQAQAFMQQAQQGHMPSALPVGMSVTMGSAGAGQYGLAAPQGQTFSGVPSAPAPPQGAPRTAAPVPPQPSARPYGQPPGF